MNHGFDETMCTATQQIGDMWWYSSYAVTWQLLLTIYIGKPKQKVVIRCIFRYVTANLEPGPQVHGPQCYFFGLENELGEPGWKSCFEQPTKQIQFQRQVFTWLESPLWNSWPFLEDEAGSTASIYNCKQIKTDEFIRTWLAIT